MRARVFSAVMVVMAAGLVCCGGPDESYAVTCAVDGIGLVDSEVALDCDTIAQNVTLAKGTLVESGVIDAADWSAVYGGTRIVIKDTEVLNEGNGDAYGLYRPGQNTIVLNKHMSALPHEMFHRLLDARTQDADGNHVAPAWSGSVKHADIEYGALSPTKPGL